MTCPFLIMNHVRYLLMLFNLLNNRLYSSNMIEFNQLNKLSNGLSTKIYSSVECKLRNVRAQKNFI